MNYYSALEKMMERVHFWSSEASTPGRKSKVKKEVEQWHQELDRISKQIQEIVIECVVLIHWKLCALVLIQR